MIDGPDPAEIGIVLRTEGGGIVRIIGVVEVTLKASESGMLTLYDLSGRIVSETSMSSGSVSIRRGVYLASFKSDDGVSSAHVIVK